MQKKAVVKVRGKKYEAAAAKLDKDKIYDLEEAVDVVKQIKFVKFDESVDIVLKLGIDAKQSDQMVRGVVSMPAGTGKKVRVAVFAKDAKLEEAKKAGADVFGGEDLVQEIQNGKIDFDCCIATPDMMGVVGKVAKILGPKGLMPNPKLGTVTPNIDQAIKNVKSGQVEFRAEKEGLIHAALGKVSFSTADLIKNLTAFVQAIVRARPAGAKGKYLQYAHLSTTMGPSLKINLTSLEK